MDLAGKLEESSDNEESDAATLLVKGLRKQLKQETGSMHRLAEERDSETAAKERERAEKEARMRERDAEAAAKERERAEKEARMRERDAEAAAKERERAEKEARMRERDAEAAAKERERAAKEQERAAKDALTRERDAETAAKRKAEQRLAAIQAEAAERERLSEIVHLPPFFISFTRPTLILQLVSFPPLCDIASCFTPACNVFCRSRFILIVSVLVRTLSISFIQAVCSLSPSLSCY
jgi:hypothetical protein